MKPVNFKESTKELKKPSSMRDDECSSLHVWSDGNQCVSKWKPTFIERIRIAFGAAIWMGIFGGSSQPPVWLDASQSPFAKLSFFNRLRLWFDYVTEDIISTSSRYLQGLKSSTNLKFFVSSFILAVIFCANDNFGGIAPAIIIPACFDILNIKKRRCNDVLHYVIFGASIGFISTLIFKMLWQS